MSADLVQIFPPWTPEQVDALNRFQRYDFVHPWTCPEDHGGADRRLFATSGGWRCPHCDYRQGYALEVMLREWTDPREAMVGLPPGDLLTPLSAVVTDDRYSNEFVGVTVRANWAEIAAALEHAAAGVFAVTTAEMDKLRGLAHGGSMMFENGSSACLEIEGALAEIADKKFRLERQIRDKRQVEGTGNAKEEAR